MDPTWIAGDGGPTVVLQSTAAALWNGTLTSAVEETDYDVICAPREDGIHVLQRHGRHMLALSDSSWSCTFVKLDSGELAILQNIALEGDLQPYVQHLLHDQPNSVAEMRVDDPVLRLLVGADTGDGSVYGYDDCAIVPGLYQVRVYLTSLAYVAILVRA